jgi:hypothetical protein
VPASTNDESVLSTQDKGHEITKRLGVFAACAIKVISARDSQPTEAANFIAVSSTDSPYLRKAAKLFETIETTISD